MHHCPPRTSAAHRLRAAAAAAGVRRATWALAAAGLIAGIVLAPGGLPWWLVLAVGLAPDVPLLTGFTPGLAQGQLAPAAVPAYNALHRAGGPLALVAVALLLERALLAPALAWGAHIAWDRALGYGLRDRRGFQRG